MDLQACMTAYQRGYNLYLDRLIVFDIDPEHIGTEGNCIWNCLYTQLEHNIRLCTPKKDLALWNMVGPDSMADQSGNYSFRSMHWNYISCLGHTHLYRSDTDVEGRIALYRSLEVRCYKSPPHRYNRHFQAALLDSRYIFASLYIDHRSCGLH